MQRINILLFLLVVCFATAVQAQTPAPKPDPEVKKLHARLGHWMVEEEFKPGPLGPGGKFTSEETDEMILGGFFLQARRTDKEGGEMLWFVWYDPVNKNFRNSGYTNDGGTWSAVLSVSGNTWTFTGKYVVAGKQYLFRNTNVFAADLMSFTRKEDISSDGKTWTPFFEGKYTKTEPAPKK